MALSAAGRIRRRGPEGEPSACVLLRLVADSHAGFEGWYVLDEVRGEAGAILWQCLRDLRLWALTPPRDRAHAFVLGATEETVRAIRGRVDLPDDVVIATAILADLPQVSAYADPGILVSACGVLAEWAARLGAPRTAAAFAQVGAFAAPALASAAASAGFAALESADLPRAETWLRRAAALARHTDWMVFAHTRATLGSLYSERGDAVRARSAYIQALRATKGQAHALELRAEVALGVYRLALARKDAREAERSARVALRALGRNHPSFLLVGIELAEHWLAAGRSDRALGLLRRLQHFHASQPQRVKVFTLLARAAAGCGDTRMLRAAWKRVLVEVRSETSAEEGVRALVDLVRGAGTAAPRDQAAAVLRKAQATARELRLPDLVDAELARRYLPAEEEPRMGEK